MWVCRAVINDHDHFPSDQKSDDVVSFGSLEVEVHKEIEIIRQSSYSYSSFLKGYHAYRNIWIPVKGEILQAEMEPSNAFDKYAVVAMRGGHVVGHLKNGKSGRFAKTIFYFLKGDRQQQMHNRSNWQ